MSNCKVSGTFRRLRGLLLPAVALACGGGCEAADFAETEGKTSAIIAGTETDARPEVGIFTTRSNCTGTLIDSKHVLTAAHCVGYQGLLRGGTFTIAGVTKPIPINRSFALGNNKTGVHDLAVAELTASVPASVATPARIATATPGFGTLLTAIGFGSSSGFGKKRFRTYVRTGDDDITDGGDSGGPHFLGMLRQDGDLGLVTSARFFIPGVSGHDTYADPPLHRDEILGLVNSLSTQGVCYRSHIANIGWLPAACNGEISGRPDLGHDLQAFQIWSARAGVSICYHARVNSREMPEVCDSDMTGTTGQSFRMDAIALGLRTSRGERLMAQANVAGLGWQPAVDVTAGGWVGQSGRGLRGMKIWIQK